MDDRSLKLLEETAERAARRLKELTNERDALRVEIERLRCQLASAQHEADRRHEAVRSAVSETLALLDEE